MMKLVFYSLILNNHQANVADELWEQTGHQYCFVELANLRNEHKKGDTRSYDDCPYLLRAWESPENYAKAMDLAVTAECCVFSGVQALPFEKARMKKGLLSFDMSERWLKRGLLNLFSPAIFRMFVAYHLGRWSKMPIYKLCCSGFAAADQHKLGTYTGKCYKWGYFTKVSDASASETVSTSGTATPLMWCSRFLTLKHPELALRMFQRLKAVGYDISLDMYGEGEMKDAAIKLAESLGISDRVTFHGNMPNDELMQEMRQHSIFLFTSDRNEGWGAVANESMSNGCVLVASDGIGSTPYLIEDGVTGYSFYSPSTSSSFDRPDDRALDSLCEKVKKLLDNPTLMNSIRHNAVRKMQEQYSPRVAAARLIELIRRLDVGDETPVSLDGPCSKA